MKPTTRRTFPRATRALLAASGLLAGACSPPVVTPGSEAGTTDAPVGSVVPHCVPGQSALCGCTDGRGGAQLCTSDGAYGSCVCSGAPINPNPPARCVPNMEVACLCDDLRMGAQVCLGDGTYAACHCDAAPLDAGTRDGATGDATSSGDGGGCNPDGGIQCDGNWVGQCAPGCTAGQCCSPQNGAFRCVSRDGAGNCPAADLFVDAPRVTSSLVQQFRYFAADNCALVERCVNGPGMRRLLRFDTRTPNTGNADMYLGQPTRTNPYFEYSTCHNHYHFNTYANYELRRTDGTAAATGHKQAFCLEDLDAYSAGVPAAHYNCGNQGIQMGWADIYTAGLDCQWIDITDVPAGTYSLRISLNSAHILNESNYDNNTAEVPVTIVAPTPDELSTDLTHACSATEQGTDRTCGWSVEGAHTCAAGATVNVGCSASCGLGTCTGDTMLRVYAGDLTAAGAVTPDLASLVTNDDSGCPLAGGATGTDFCSNAHFTCPAGGRYTVVTAPYHSDQTAVCNVAIH